MSGDEAGPTANGPEAAGSHEDLGYRDRDPAPSYSGEDAETTFRACERAVQLWEFETDVPTKK